MINNGKKFCNILAVVYYSVWYQNGIKNPFQVPKTLDI